MSRELEKEPLDAVGVKLEEFAVKISKMESIPNYDYKVQTVNAIMKHGV
ncbi:MAG: hypothetical protein MTP17_01355 [Candidatus Midichloria sp.]|nr:MAG: hypothetical protein MTP17_01355 [Candidatus Midichloria sp.]